MYAPERNLDSKPLTVQDFAEMKVKQEPIACLTAYDASFAAVEDRAGVDVVLVGDSLGMVIQGHDTTVPVTVDHIIYHSATVARGLGRAFLMADMPFLSFSTRDAALTNAARLMREGGAKMVKLEAGETQADIVEYLTTRGVPVCGHIGLQPQLVHKLGGFKVQGRESDAADGMLRDALALQQAGADMLLIECVPEALGQKISAAVDVPVIGIGAGRGVDGQILVLHDILNITSGKKPRFAENFLAGQPSIDAAVIAYVEAVKSGTYPAEKHCFSA